MKGVFHGDKRVAGKIATRTGRATKKPLSVRYAELLALRRKLLEAEQFDRHDQQPNIIFVDFTRRKRM